MSELPRGMVARGGLRPERRIAGRLKRSLLVGLAGFCIAGAWLFAGRDHSGIHHIPVSDAYCSVEVLAKPNVAAARFEIVDVSCDTLAKDETVRIYELTPYRSWLGQIKDRETLLFGYDPGRSRDDLPEIAVGSEGGLTISTPWIASIWYKADRWNGRLINFEIGRIDYP